MNSYFTVSADGVDYSLFFADYTVNAIDADNVGIYALGVTTSSAGRSGPFFEWAGSFRMDLSDADDDAYPGVFVGYDNAHLSLNAMEEIVEDLAGEDVLGLREDGFTEYVQAEHATEIDDEIDELYALLPEGEVVWQKGLQDEPVVRESSENGGKTLLLLSTYRVKLGSTEYWLSFAYFPENAIDPSNVGVYAIGVAPRTETGDSAAEQALFAWADSFDVDASVPPGIFISQ